MDPIGLGFGHFDASGQYQTTDANGAGRAGSPPSMRAAWSIRCCPGGLSTPFDGAVDLARQLAASASVQQCFALEEIRYALGRVESQADACSAQQIFGSFAANGYNLQKLLVAVVRSDAFRYRTAVRNAGSACQ